MNNNVKWIKPESLSELISDLEYEKEKHELNILPAMVQIDWIIPYLYELQTLKSSK